jgi:hypothetical protein
MRAAARAHHPRIRERLAEKVETFDARVKPVYRIDGEGFQQLATDPRGACRRRKAAAIPLQCRPSCGSLRRKGSQDSGDVRQ